MTPHDPIAAPTRRLRVCVDAWPECEEGAYDPRCCRFPKSCSCTVYDEAQVSEADLEPRSSRGKTRRVTRHYWACSCGTRNQRITQKCACGQRRPKRHVPKHAVTLRDDSYERYNELAKLIHGVTDESCCVCGKPRGQERRHDRDHDHTTGKPRGLACVHCNRHMPRGLTLELARLIVGYLKRVDAYYATEKEETA